MITVRDLKEMLAGLPDNAVVILGKDNEGNDFSPLSSEVDGTAEYRPDNPYRGEVWFDEDRTGEGIPAIVLWPSE